MSSEGDARPRRVDLPAPTIAAFLAITPLFADCDRATIDKIAPHVFAAEVPAGVVIVRAGTPHPGIGFVYAGRATVRHSSGVVEEDGVGEAFGETGAFLGAAQPFEVSAAEDSVVFLLGHDVVTQLAAKVAAFSFAAARRLAARSITQPPATRMKRQTTGPLPTDGIRFVRVSAYDPTPQVIATVPAKLIQQRRLLPLELRDRTLTVGMVDPTSSASRTELQRVTATTSVSVVAISQDDFNEAYVRLRIDPVRAGRGTRPPEHAVPPEHWCSTRPTRSATPSSPARSATRSSRSRAG